MNLGSHFPLQPDWPWLRANHSGNILLHVDCPLEEVVRRVGSRLAYLATPYTKAVRTDDRLWDRGLSLDIEAQTARWSRAFAIAGVTVASPIVMSCAMCRVDLEGQLDPLDERFWARWCQPMLSASGAVVIPAMEGWDRSLGVWREACWALLHNVPVYLVAQGAEPGAGA